MAFGFWRKNRWRDLQPRKPLSPEEEAKVRRAILILYSVMFALMILNGYLFWKYGRKQPSEKPPITLTNSSNSSVGKTHLSTTNSAASVPSLHTNKTPSSTRR